MHDPGAFRLFMKARDQCHLDEKLVLSPKIVCRRWWQASIATLELTQHLATDNPRQGNATELSRQHGNKRATMFKAHCTGASAARVSLVEAISLLAGAQVDLRSQVAARSWVSYRRQFLQ